MTPAETLARALDDMLGMWGLGYEPGESALIDNAHEALATWRSQQAAMSTEGDRFLPEPFFRTSTTGGAYSIEQMRAHFEAGRQRGMDQAHALWELAKSSQEITKEN